MSKLIPEVKGVPYSEMQPFFAASTVPLSCLYLVAFNTVSNLRDVMDIPKEHKSNSMVYKIGLTDSFEDRKRGHVSKREYKHIYDVTEFKLVKYAYIDPEHVSAAEKELKDKLSKYFFKYKDHTELIIAPSGLLTGKLIPLYDKLGKKYCGKTREVNKQLKKQRHKFELLEKDNTLLLQDNEIAMLEKDNEILRLKLLLCQNGISY